MTGLVLLLLLGPLVGSGAPVAEAAERGAVEALRQLLRQGADVNAAQGDGMTALHWAAERGDAEMARLLVYAGAHVNAGTRIGSYTPLHVAARHGHGEVVKILLQAKADPVAATANTGATPLHLAAASGRVEAVAALVQAGADANAAEGSWGQTPLIFAAASGRTDAVRELLRAGANPAVAARAVDVVEMERGDKASERRLAEFLADFRKKEGGGIGWQPSPSQVQAAIEASRQVQRKWPDVPRPGEEEAKGKQAAPGPGDKPEGEQKEPGKSKPAQAAAEENAAVATAAAGAGKEAATAAPPTKYNAEGEPINEAPAPKGKNEPEPPSYGQLVGAWGGLTPLLHAVRQGHTDTALALLEGGADINQPSAGDQTTPLLMAAVNGQFDLALILLRRGANPNLASQAGTTPLYAVLERTWAPKASYAHPIEHQQQKATHLEVMKTLLEAGADPNVRLKKHLWYMEYTFGVLRAAGIDLEGATPFWRAAYALDVEAMRLLKAHGADPLIPTVKPPERRRRPSPPPAEKPVAPAKEAPKAAADSEAAKNATKVNAEGLTEEERRRRAEEEEGKDHSGVPPVPVGGPAISPLHAAAGAGYGLSFAGNAHRYVPDNWLAAVKFLVEECGADVNIRDANAYTPLHHAAARGDNELILYLVERGADVTVVSRKGQTTADMANGPIQRVPPYPATVALLERLGSKNNHKCVSC